MSYTRLNPPIRVTNCGASNVTMAAKSTYYANLGSSSDMPGYEPIGVDFNMVGMSSFVDLVASAIQNNGSGGYWSRIYNNSSSANTGSWSAKVYWAKV